VVLLVLAGCGDDDDGGGDGGGGGGADASFVAANAPRYQESREVDNGTRAGAEATGLTVSAGGFVIEGSFEVGAPTSDTYRINTGPFGGATRPDFPGIDAIAFVDGKRMSTAQTEVMLALDAVADDGFSTLSLGGFLNAAVTRNVDYLLFINPSATVAGKPYRIEVRGH